MNKKEKYEALTDALNLKLEAKNLIKKYQLIVGPNAEIGTQDFEFLCCIERAYIEAENAAQVLNKVS